MSSQRWFNALGSNSINIIKVYQTESGQITSTLLKTFNVDVTTEQLITIKIPKEDLGNRLKSIEVEVGNDDTMESYLWSNFQLWSTGGWIYCDLLE